jgi:hypothetical protein
MAKLVGERIFEISLPTYIGTPRAAEIASSAAAFYTENIQFFLPPNPKTFYCFGWRVGSEENLPQDWL